MCSGVLETISVDEKPQMIHQQAAAAADMSVVVESQMSYEAAGSGSGTVVDVVNDTVPECEMPSMPECQPPADFEPAPPPDTDHSQNCNNAGAVLFCVLS